VLCASFLCSLLDFTEVRDSEWQWHQLGRMQVCTLLQTDNHTSTPPLSVFTGRMPFLPPNQRCQSTEGIGSAVVALLQTYWRICQLKNVEKTLKFDGVTAMSLLSSFFGDTA